ncbi:MAG TPA: type 1 glutamine amidotransferase family protein [Gemmatimonadales bacterium]|nr:type 1 glutamine amidotransferase family protein [Gemmatimonadales bacterium]
MTPAVHVLVFDGFADWEPAFALAELRRSGGLDVVTLGFSSAPVRSMGGLRVVPDRSLSDADPATVRLLILPGGDLWEGEYPRGELEAVLTTLHQAGVPVAAICGATVALARAGWLDDHAHTSNELGYLERLVPEYAGASRYVDALAVRDRGLITASGVGPTEFAREIFEELQIFSAAERPVWYHLFKHGRLPEPAA